MLFCMDCWKNHLGYGDLWISRDVNMEGGGRTVGLSGGRYPDRGNSTCKGPGARVSLVRWTQHMQRPWGRNELGELRDQQAAIAVS